MSYGYIYTTYDHFHNKIYVGKRVKSKDIKSYYGSGIIICRIIKKRKHHLEKRILGYCETKEELDEAEKICIEFFDAQNPVYGYNLSPGGTGGPLRQGMKSSQETCNKISYALKGKRKKYPSWNKGKTSWSKGKHFTEAHKLKIKVAHIGKRNACTRHDISVYDVNYLRNQGLSYSKIAQQLNCSIQVVVNRLKNPEKYI